MRIEMNINNAIFCPEYCCGTSLLYVTGTVRVTQPEFFQGRAHIYNNNEENFIEE